MDRRQALSLLTLAGIGAAAQPVLAAAATGTKEVAPKAAGGTANERLAAAALECIQSGAICLQHCIRSLSTGSTMMADCAKTVTDMLAQAKATHQLAVADSKHLAAAAKLMSTIAKDCEAACRKHESMHVECKRCADCCARIAEAAAAI